MLRARAQAITLNGPNVRQSWRRPRKPREASIVHLSEMASSEGHDHQSLGNSGLTARPWLGTSCESDLIGH